VRQRQAAPATGLIAPVSLDEIQRERSGEEPRFSRDGEPVRPARPARPTRVASG